MTVTFLGTGTSQGVPVIACDCNTCRSGDIRDNRLRTSVMIQNVDTVIVIDSGPDFRQQLLREKVKKLNAVLFTHEHKDHIAGLDDVRSFNWIYKKPMDVYCDSRVKMALEREFAYVFLEIKYPGIPQLKIHLIENKPFKIENIKIIPIEGLHYKLPVFGFRIKDFTYLTDINFIPEKEKPKIKGSKYLVVGAVRKQKHISHYNLEQAIDVINEFSPETGYITHISHMMGCHEEVEKELPSTIRLAYDGLKLEI
ncbi:MAG: MBL fold metallo-hydrolase [Bacteroidia bacterium]|nr:MBL fold metallo-hydrolase [Bacteroidia bacterium]